MRLRFRYGLVVLLGFLVLASLQGVWAQIEPLKPPSLGRSGLSFDRWLESNMSIFEQGLSIRKAARRLARDLRTAGWTEASVSPYEAMTSIKPPLHPQSSLSDDDLLERTRRYEELATPSVLLALAAARQSLDELPTTGLELTPNQHALLEQTLGYSRYVGEAHVALSEVVRQFRLDLFDPKDHAAVTRGIQIVHDTLNTSTRGSTVLGALEVIRRAYEMHQVQAIVDLVSDRWFQRGEHPQDAKSLPQALNNDFRNLINIRLVFTPSTVSARDGEYHVGVHWSRRATIARANRHWVREDRFAIFVFTTEAGKIKLLRTEGEVPLALSNRLGVLLLTEGTLDHDVIEQPVRVENGLITGGDPRGPTRRGVATVSGGAQGAGFLFSSGQRLALQATGFSGDLVFRPRVVGGGIVGLDLASALTGGLQVLPATTMSAVQTVPVSGYSTLRQDASTLAVTGQVIAVLTADGRYAKVRVARVHHTAAGFTVVFEWVYQPDGAPSVP